MSDWVFVSKKDSVGSDIKYKAGPPDFDGAGENCWAINTLGFYKDKITLPLRESAYMNDADGIYIRRRALDDLFEALDEGGIELQQFLIDDAGE